MGGGGHLIALSLFIPGILIKWSQSEFGNGCDSPGDNVSRGSGGIPQRNLQTNTSRETAVEITVVFIGRDSQFYDTILLMLIPIHIMLMIWNMDGQERPPPHAHTEGQREREGGGGRGRGRERGRERD